MILRSWLNRQISRNLGDYYLNISFPKYVYLRFCQWQSDRATRRFNEATWERRVPKMSDSEFITKEQLEKWRKDYPDATLEFGKVTIFRRDMSK